MRATASATNTASTMLMVIAAAVAVAAAAAEAIDGPLPNHTQDGLLQTTGEGDNVAATDMDGKKHILTELEVLEYLDEAVSGRPPPPASHKFRSVG